MSELKLQIAKLDAFGRAIQRQLLSVARNRFSSVRTTRGVVELLARQVGLDPAKVTDDMIEKAFDQLDRSVKEQVSR